MERRTLLLSAASLPIIVLLPSAAMAEKLMWPGPFKIIHWEVGASLDYRNFVEEHDAQILYEDADGFIRNVSYMCPTEKDLCDTVFYGLADRSYTGEEFPKPSPGEGRNPELRRIYG